LAAFLHDRCLVTLVHIILFHRTISLSNKPYFHSTLLLILPFCDQELSTREKAYHKSVHLESVDKHAKEIEQSKLKQNWTHCWDLVEKPRDRFVKYHQTIRTSDKMKDLGLQRGGYFLPE